MSIRYGTQTFDVLAYVYEFSGSITAEEIAKQTGTDQHGVLVTISRLRKLGLVMNGRPYRPSKMGIQHYEEALKENGIP